MPEVGEWVRERHEEKRRKMMEMMKQLQGLFCLGVCGRRVGSNGEENDTLSDCSRSKIMSGKSKCIGMV